MNTDSMNGAWSYMQVQNLLDTLEIAAEPPATKRADLWATFPGNPNVLMVHKIKPGWYSVKFEPVPVHPHSSPDIPKTAGN